VWAKGMRRDIAFFLRLAPQRYGVISFVSIGIYAYFLQNFIGIYNYEHNFMLRSSRFIAQSNEIMLRVIILIMVLSLF
jgi:hypothetical protein